MISEIQAGTLINHRYLINRLIGQGGFGRTYLAFDKHRFDETCVLKEFVPATTQGNIFNKSQELFEREAKVLSQLKHPQIPKFLAFIIDGQRLFIVQEYIDGKTYSQILRERLSSTGKPFSESEVKTWLQGILPILEYIHLHKIIHRDISLDNVMLPNNKTQPVLIDFGVVKEKLTQFFSASNLNQGNNLNNSHYSLQGSIVGKIGYSPPEQLRLGQCYPSSDLYALGVCAIVLLTGRMPHLLIDESLKWRWQCYIKVSQSFANILDKMLAEKAGDRFQSANEIILELNNHNQHQNQSRQSLLNVFQRQITQPKQPKTNTNSFKQNSEAPTQLHPQAPVSLNREFLEDCQQQLTSFVGPFASVLMQDILEKSPHLAADEFIEVISNQIPNTQRAKIFRDRIKVLLESASGRFNSSIPSQQSNENNPAMTNPAFLNHCRQELTSFVGPVANIIIEDTLAKHPSLTPKQLVETLVSEIPSEQRAREFKESINKYIVCT
jgi:serine/threonine protein kinase